MFVTLQRFALFVLQGEYHALNRQTKRGVRRAFDSPYRSPLKIGLEWWQGLLLIKTADNTK